MYDIHTVLRSTQENISERSLSANQKVLRTSDQVPDGISGNLFLGINDDLTREYGKGFSDNEGSVTVSINMKPKKRE